MISALSYTFLAAQYAALQAEFVRRYPRPWLVWEAGRWNAPTLQASPADTVTPPPDAPGSAHGREPLFFHLPQGPQGITVISVGRALSNTVVINDATVSRQHVMISEKPDTGWFVEVVAEAKPAKLQNEVVAPGQTVALPSGSRLGLGGVALTFLSASDFLQQLKTAVDGTEK